MLTFFPWAFQVSVLGVFSLTAEGKEAAGLRFQAVVQPPPFFPPFASRTHIPGHGVV
jgi:hypothetical protein